MKILHIHTTMRQGGIESMVSGLANEMAKGNDKVSLCSIFKPDENTLFWKKLSPNIEKFDLGKLTPGFSLKEIFKVFRVIKNGHYDVVNMHGCFYYYALTVLLLHRSVQFFYTVHSDAFMENAGWDNRITWFKRFCFKHGWVHPITISKVSQESFTKLYGCDSTLIPNGVPNPIIIGEHNIIDDLRYSPSTKVFLHPGRISTPKNQVVLVKAFDRLIKDGKDVALLIVGANEDKGIFHEMKPYFSERIIYAGECSNIPELFAKADAFCLPSIWEGMPITLLESLSVGCIPICSPVGGIVNVINSGVNGLLSASSSEDDYYATLSNFLNMTDEEIKIMHQKCKESFEPYNISNTANSYINTYSKYVKAH